MIIIPDIHGRWFWQQPVKENLGKEQILFLGDYLDPYHGERISSEQAFRQLEYLVEFKQLHPDDITLLLGNHDIHYLTPMGRGSRFDYVHGAWYNMFFRQHADLFQLACETEAGGRKYLFSHAGILAGWIERHRKDLDGATPQTVSRVLNDMWLDHSTWLTLFSILADIPESRWGSAPYGSPVWSDVQDMRTDAPELPGYYQIFGHSQQPGLPVINDYFACLDCRRAFRLRDNGNLCSLDENKNEN